MILLEGLHHISLGTADLERSVEFYQNVLGFDLLEREELCAVLNLDPIAVRFNLVQNYKAAVTNPGEFSFAYVLDVDDFTNALEELESRGVEIKGPLAIEGGESMVIKDPDGHLIELFYNE